MNTNSKTNKLFKNSKQELPHIKPKSNNIHNKLNNLEEDYKKYPTQTGNFHNTKIES